MKTIEEYKSDISVIFKDMAKIEGCLDAVLSHQGNELYEQAFGDVIRNDMPEVMKSITKLAEMMRMSFALDYLTTPINPDKAHDILEVYTNLEFIDKQMKTIMTKHMVYYFNENK